MATNLNPTWDRATKRWVKIYRGRKLCLGYGKSKTDRQSHQSALEPFDLEKAKTDREAKPFAAEYESRQTTTGKTRCRSRALHRSGSRVDPRCT